MANVDRLRERETARKTALEIIEELFDTSIRDNPAERSAYLKAFRVLDRIRERHFSDLGRA